MKNALKIAIGFLALCLIIFFALGYLSSFIGWYGYKKWEYRVATSNILESKKRGVFVKELHFKIENFPDTIEGFRSYIERGFRYGRHSSEETVPLTNSNYPYQLSFNFHASEKIGLFMKEAELKKFDSANINRGFLKTPDLRDTITVNLVGENIRSGIIKIWQ